MKARAIRILAPTIAIAVIWAGAIWYPQQRSISESRAATTDSITEQQTLSAEIASLRQSSDRIDEIRVELDGLRSAIPEHADVGPFARHVDTLAQQAGVELDLLSPILVANDQTVDAGTPLPAGVSSISLSIGGTATYDEFMAFADDLVASERLVVIDTVSLTAAEDDSGELTVDVGLRIFTTAELVETDPSLLFDLETGEPIDELVDDAEDLDLAEGTTP